jgi:cytochrome b subunit of formate dehydrogenase
MIMILAASDFIGDINIRGILGISLLGDEKLFFLFLIKALVVFSIISTVATGYIIWRKRRIKIASRYLLILVLLNAILIVLCVSSRTIPDWGLIIAVWPPPTVQELVPFAGGHIFNTAAICIANIWKKKKERNKEERKK